MGIYNFGIYFGYSMSYAFGNFLYDANIMDEVGRCFGIVVVLELSFLDSIVKLSTFLYLMYIMTCSIKVLCTF